MTDPVHFTRAYQVRRAIKPDCYYRALQVELAMGPPRIHKASKYHIRGVRGPSKGYADVGSQPLTMMFKNRGDLAVDAKYFVTQTDIIYTYLKPLKLLSSNWAKHLSSQLARL